MSEQQHRAVPAWRAGTTDRSVLEQAVDAVTVRRVFGEAYEVGGSTVVPVARVRGWGGGGGGSGEEKDSSGSGSGVGYGVRAEPAGVYVVRGDGVTWRPAVHAERIALTLGLALCGAITVVGWAAVTRRS
ncbi:spore germination protein GerW family protein [Kocuria rosea]|uniref:spore germination protein GerW family protein n=1 Tax=Kocuria rosea TaxID=1275 RepID=UPI000AFDC08F|nr:spore germination protein GerW family protein [Kocuria polaris]